MFKVNIKYIVLLSIAFIISYIFGGKLLYSVFYALLIMLLYELIYIFNRSKTVEFSVELENKIYIRGENTEIFMNVSNNSSLENYYMHVFNINFNEFDNKYKGDLFSLGSYEVLHFKKNISLSRIGKYNFGNIEYTTYGPMFLTSSKKKIIEDTELRVYPKVYKIKDDLQVKNDVFKKFILSKTGREDLYTVRDVRKYVDGDNPKKIHWKISARYGDLFVRNVDNVMGQQCDLLLDMNSLKIDEEEDMQRGIELCVSIVNYMVLNGVRSRIYVNNSPMKNFKVATPNEFNELMNYFVDNKSNGNRIFSNFISTNIDELKGSNWIGVICKTLNDNIVETLMKMQDLCSTIFVFYGSCEFGKAYVNKFSRLGINCISLNEAENLFYKNR